MRAGTVYDIKRYTHGVALGAEPAFALFCTLASAMKFAETWSKHINSTVEVVTVFAEPQRIIFRAGVQL